jgi:hypothetical protein
MPHVSAVIVGTSLLALVLAFPGTTHTLRHGSSPACSCTTTALSELCNRHAFICVIKTTQVDPAPVVLCVPPSAAAADSGVLTLCRIFRWIGVPAGLAASVAYFIGPSAFWFFVARAVGSVLLLEVVNYLEHYGTPSTTCEKATTSCESPSYSVNSEASCDEQIIPPTLPRS